MTRRIEPFWTLIFGFIAAPLLCGINAGLGDSLSGFDAVRFTRVALNGSSAVVMTWPLGVMTWLLLHIWNDGHFHRARLVSLGCGLVSAAFWAWTETVFSTRT